MTILDTNVLSELTKPAPSPDVIRWVRSRGLARDLYLTTITVAEVLFGIGLLQKGKRRDSLLGDAEATFTVDFAGRILPFDEAAARAFPEIAVLRRVREGRFHCSTPRLRPSQKRTMPLSPRATPPILRAAACGW